MLLFPAIDILNSQAVRLLHGDYNKVTVYGQPLEMANKWKLQGAEYLHIVDLNGAKDGLSKNLNVIKEIVENVNINIQLGGGIRTLENIRMILDIGVTRVILGSICVLNPDLVRQAIKEFGSERIVCGIDSKNEKVAINGWLEDSSDSPYDLGLKMSDAGVKYVVFTDITRDGALTGVNVDASSKMMQKTGLKVIASGGVSTLQDLIDLNQKNLYGAILGKAIYDNRFNVEQAINILK